MESNTEKIELYAVRSFGERLTVVMDFLRQNWKPVLIYLTYFLLPLSLVQALNLNGFMGGYLDILSSATHGAEEPSASSLLSFVLHTLGFIGFYVVGMLLLDAVLYGMMRLYQHGDGKLGAVEWKDLKPDFMFSLKRATILTLASTAVGMAFLVVLGLIMVGLALISPALILLGYLLMLAVIIALLPPLSLITPAYVFEDNTTLMGAIRKGCRLGFKTWGSTVAVMLILSLIINIISQFTALPWSIMFIVKMFFGLGLDGLDGSFTESVFFTFGTYLSGVLQCFGGYVASAALVIGAAYLYGHAAEKLDSFTVDSNIQNFENL